MSALIFALLWSGLQVSAQSFLNGTDFTAVRISGELYLTCQQGPQSVTVRRLCRDEILLPVSSDYFFTENKVNGDRVRLTAIYENGKSNSIILRYNPNTGKTSRPVPLWTREGGERGLLNYGENLITFEYMNSNKELLKDGQLRVQVRRESPRQCRPGRDFSGNINECYYGDMIERCRQYFEWEAYCEN